MSSSAPDRGAVFFYGDRITVTRSLHAHQQLAEILTFEQAVERGRQLLEAVDIGFLIHDLAAAYPWRDSLDHLVHPVGKVARQDALDRRALEQHMLQEARRQVGRVESTVVLCDRAADD